MNRTALIVHPVRSRILTCLIGRQLTTRQLAKLMPEVPLPSLYRHVRTLAGAGMIVSVDEIPVRGVVEHVYALARGGGQIPDAEAAEFGPAERQGALDNFLSLLSVSYRAYLESGGEAPAHCGAVALYLSPQEEETLRVAMVQAIRAAAENTPSAQRRRVLLSHILQPDLDLT
jgi:hypothetical protein